MYNTQEKLVNTVAVGIGKGIDEGILQQIAGAGNPVVQVEDFAQLQNMIETIKASACSGAFSDDSVGKKQLYNARATLR